MAFKELARNKAFDGQVVKYEHASTELSCSMKFNVFLPKESQQGAVPAIYFLSGLTCTEDNFIQKSGALAEAAKHGVALIAPDTSPREYNERSVWNVLANVFVVSVKQGVLVSKAKMTHGTLAPVSNLHVAHESVLLSCFFKQGAGFYLDATDPKWAKHYRMYSYITQELPALVNKALPIVSGRVWRHIILLLTCFFSL